MEPTVHSRRLKIIILHWKTIRTMLRNFSVVADFVATPNLNEIVVVLLSQILSITFSFDGL
jgi:hypothetical protein